MPQTAQKNQSPELRAAKLKAHFSEHEGAIIAYSGGVDSALLAYVAHRALGKNMLAALADSPSLSRREYRQALNFAQTHDIPLQIIQTQEMKNPLYAANQGDRCYHRKKALFERIVELRIQPENPLSGSPWPVFYGVNLDDLGDHRPGIQAAKADFSRLLKNRENISKQLHELGFIHVSLDLDGFKSGSLNAILKFE